MKKVEVVVYADEHIDGGKRPIETVTHVMVSHRECSARRSVGRGIEWMVAWHRGEDIPRPESMTLEQRDTVAQSVASAIQRLGEPEGGGFTPRQEPSRVRNAVFDG